jgi:hypothetical protein
MASRSITEFGRSRRLIKSDGLQHLVSVCEQNKNICKSVTMIATDDFWTSRKILEVIPRHGAVDRVGAFSLIDGELTREQREFLKVYLQSDAAENKSKGGQ